MRITNAGDVGIGGSPTVRLDVRGSTGDLVNVSDGTQNLKIGTASGLVAFIDAAPGGGILSFRAAGVERARLDATNGNFLITSTGGLGYGSGSGGTVTQITSKSTSVTLNKLSGQVTMSNAALAANTTASFVVSNSAYTTSIDTAVAVITGGVANGGNYLCWTSNGGSGSFQVNVRNISAGSLSEAVAINVFVIRGAVT
jgi:hypothetical protein